VCYIVFALASLSQYISSISRSIAAAREIHVAQNRRVSDLHAFFAQHRIPFVLACRATHVLKVRQMAGSGRISAKQVEALGLLPQNVHDEILYEAYIPTLSRHPLFDMYTTADPEGARSITATAICTVYVAKNEAFSEAVDGLNFVVAGELLYMFRQDIAAVVHPGMWCCEETFWGAHPALPGQLVADVSGCDILTVVAKTFQNITLKRKRLLRILTSYASIFVEQFNRATDENENASDLLFNDRHECAHYVEKALKTSILSVSNH